MAQINILSEIGGSVWKILVKPGDSVAEEDHLVILESMKMEIPVLATESGTVAEIRVAEGQAVSKGDVVVVLST